MKIKKVKVTMSRIGITTMDAPRRVVYMPLAKIDYMEKEHRSQTVHLDQTFIPDKKFLAYSSFCRMILSSRYSIAQIAG